MPSLKGLTVFIVLCLAGAAAAAEAPLRVAVVDGREPFVSQKDGIWIGLSMDIWASIVAANKWQFVFVPYPSEDAMIDAVASGEADVAVADLSITKARLERAEFSQPYFRSGLQVMVTDPRPHTFARLLSDLGTWGHLTVLWVCVGVIALLTLLVTLFERKHNKEFPKSWHDGLAEAFYWVVSLALTGKSAYKGFSGALGRLMLVVWMLAGVVMVAYVTSTITSAMTVEKLQASHISGLSDLPGHPVGALAGTSVVPFLQKRGLDVREYPGLREAVDDLIAERIDAIVGDAPLLQYFDYSHPELPVTEVGPIFDPQNYGIALPIGSVLRQPLNRALLQLVETGTLMDMAKRYFGSVYQP